MPLSLNRRDGTWQLIVCFIALSVRSGKRFTNWASSWSFVTGLVLVAFVSTSMMVAITPGALGLSFALGLVVVALGLVVVAFVDLGLVAFAALALDVRAVVAFFVVIKSILCVETVVVDVGSRPRDSVTPGSFDGQAGAGPGVPACVWTGTGPGNVPSRVVFTEGTQRTWERVHAQEERCPGRTTRSRDWGPCVRWWD